MKKVTHCANRGIVFLLCISLVSCIKEATFTCNPENKEWLVAYELGYNFVMKDNNDITNSYALTDNSNYYLESEGGHLFIKTHREKTEYYYQNFSASYGLHFDLSLTAGRKPFGDELRIELGDINFTYDCRHKVISHIYTPFGILSKMMTENGYEYGDTIHSTVEILDSYTVNNIEYSGVLHFTCKDFSESWEPFTVKELFIAKKIGLIKYTLNNHITYQRI